MLVMLLLWHFVFECLKYFYHITNNSTLKVLKGKW